MLKDVAEAVKQLVEPQPEYEKISGMVVETDEDNQLIIKAPEAAPQAETADLTTLISTPREPRQTASQQYVPPVAEETFVPETPVDTNRPNLAVNQAPQPIQQVPLEAAPVQAATPAASADPAQVMQQIMARVNTISAEGFAELKMTLKPESLGDVSLRIITQNGVVMAMFVAESQRIKEIIESNFNQLRYALEAQGIEVSQLFVSVGEDDSQQQMYEFLKAQQEAMRRLQRASGVLNEAEEVAVEEEILIDNTVSFTA
jgi:flagellar hook-length control protein FliK